MASGFLPSIFGNSQPTNSEEDFVLANRLATLVTVITGVFVLLYIVGMRGYLGELGNREVMAVLVLSFVLIAGASVYALHDRFVSKSLPYVVLGSLISVDVLLYAVMGYATLNLFLITIILYARYHDLVIMRRAMVASLIGYALGVALGFVFDFALLDVREWHTLMGLDYEIPANYVTEQLVQLGALLLACAICYGMTISGVGLAKGNAALARARTQMEAAGEIQQHLLPGNLDLGEDGSFELCARVAPIFDASGDYYDYEYKGNTCTFVVADVSDKGIPAAMFAMRSQSLLRAYLSAQGISEGLRSANRALCENNESCMFVSAIAGELDVTTGHVRYVNAGHEPLAIKRGSAVELAVPEGPDPALGLFEEADYQVREFDLEPGSAFVAFTDGITDAAREDGEAFGVDRLKAYLEGCAAEHAAGLCEGLLAAASEFCGTSDQFDDMTVLALCFRGAPDLRVLASSDTSAQLAVACTYAGLHAAIEHVRGALDRSLCSEELRSNAGVVVDELGSNIIEHAFDDPSGHAFELSYQVESRGLRLRFVDEGAPFDPLERERAYDGRADEDDGPSIGGWGIHLVCNLADEVSYQREGARNVLDVAFLRGASEG